MTSASPSWAEWLEAARRYDHASEKETETSSSKHSLR